jgi:hypothetical protein
MTIRRLRSTMTPLCLLFCWLLGAALPRASAQRVAAAPPNPTISLSTSRTGNFFQPGQPVSVSVTLTNGAAVARSLILTEALLDFTGTATQLYSGTVTLPAAGPTTSSVPLPIHGLGYFELDVTLTDPATGNTLASNQISIGVLPPQAITLSPQSPFGVAGNLTQAYNGKQQELSTAARVIALAGIGYVREEINWHDVQKVPGSGPFNWAPIDAAVMAEHSAGLTILGLLDYWNTLPQPTTTVVYSGTQKLNAVTGCALGPACAYTPQGIALFAQFAAAAVNRYKPGGTLAQQEGWTDGYGITDWEVWNEPSNPLFWRQDLQNSAGIFAALYSAAASAIRGAEPQARIMYDESGTAIDQAIAAGGATHDILAIHSYTGGLDPDSALMSPTLPRGGQGTAPAAISEFVAQGKPVWITETGYATDGTVTPRQQADYLVREFVNFLAEHVSKEFWFKFREDNPGGANLYGLVHEDFSPKPAYLAYATMTRQLTGTTFAQQVQLGAAVRGFLFTSPQGTTAVLYSLAENGTITFPLNGAQGSIYDLMDNQIAQQTSGTFSVPISQDPVYVVLPGMQSAQVAAALSAAQITGISPLGASIQPAPGLINGLPNIKLTLTARTNVPVSGTAILQLPQGWTAVPASQRFPILQPSQSTTLSYRLTSEVSHPGDTITASVTLANGIGVISATATLANYAYALTYGHPQIDGSLATWSTASELDLINLQPNQVVGIPGWTPQNISARVYTMWDEKYFYLAADVHDMTFDYAPVGYNMYQGDSIQYGWGMNPQAWNTNSGPERYNVTAGLTHQGPANFQYNILGPWPDMLVQIKPDPATGDMIYTTAVPWSRLGNFVPKVGKQFAFDLLINQNEHHSRIGWIQITPGMGIGFYPSEFPLWTLIQNNPAAGVRIGAGAPGGTAPTTTTFTLPTSQGSVVIHDGGMRQIVLSINGSTPITFTAGTHATPTGTTFTPFGSTTLDLSQYLRTGTNTVTIYGTPATRLGAAVLSFFQ